MDFSKAFDVVPHRRLLMKLEHLGIRHNINRWIEDFLSNRTQNVIIDGESSTSSPVFSGVPQGTVLGPLLFLVYINNLPDCVASDVRMFADDLILYRQINSHNDCVNLQKDINSLCNWETAWQMRFNKSKCFIMRMTHKKNIPHHAYSMGDSILQEVKHHPYLGVELSSDLTWSKHINQSVNSANKILGLIKRNFWNCASSARETAYKALVRPKLEYASVIWDPHQKIHTESLEKVQRRAARFVKNEYSRFSSVSDMLKDLNWDTLENRRFKARLVTIYKETHGLIPSNINNLLEEKKNQLHVNLTV
ncbi:putative RNA-directed DNA polymerase from mobile element jockey-like [Apostichopus japonicus]|uniref:Putative RNA-directed DNA polymerase from mobile element jockey-like n=1 Tax=Stichopus japonicus TaxID=307972 RepID=A0A2G8JFI5_STIJA|nr:putative RNA-directed DNA polymerase from mobile element jockey-like [Apostichopus japonicus]